MKTAMGNDVRYTDKHRHKFGSALAEYVYDTLASGGWDSRDGYHDADLGEHYDRVGQRHILESDSRGFVDITRFDTVEECDAAWTEIGEYFAKFWADEEGE